MLWRFSRDVHCYCHNGVVMMKDRKKGKLKAGYSFYFTKQYAEIRPRSILLLRNLMIDH